MGILAPVMDAEKQRILDHKKKQLQLKLQVQQFIKLFLTDWLPVYDGFTTVNIPFKLVHLACTTTEELPFWETEFKQNVLQPYDFKTSQLHLSETDPVRQEIENIFPSVNPLRYVPGFPDVSIYGDSWLSHLLRAQKELGFADDTPVFLLYMRFAPVVQLRFGDILQLKDDPIWHTEDMVICATDMSRLVCRTLEDSWHWGKKPQIPADTSTKS